MDLKILKVRLRFVNGEVRDIPVLDSVHGIRDSGEGQRPIACEWYSKPVTVDDDNNYIHVNMSVKDALEIKDWLYSDVLNCLHANPKYKAQESFRQLVKEWEDATSK